MHFSNHIINTFHIHILVLEVWFKRIFSLFFTTCWSCKPEVAMSKPFYMPFSQWSVWTNTCIIFKITFVTLKSYPFFIW